MHNNFKVMVVDDDRVVLATLADWLTEMGYRVVTRDEAPGTLAAIAKEEPDLILLDVSMPMVNGDRIADLITKNPKFAGIKVIYYSSMPSSDIAALVKKTGVLGSLQKTGDEEQFMRGLRNLIGP